MFVKTLGNAVVITSALKKEEIEALGKYNPKALVLKENDEEVFSVSVGNKGAFGKYGVVFDGVNADGNATITILSDLSDVSPEKIREKIVSEYGEALWRLEALEASALEAAAETNRRAAALAGGIEVC